MIPCFMNTTNSSISLRLLRQQLHSNCSNHVIRVPLNRHQKWDVLIMFLRQRQLEVSPPRSIRIQVMRQVAVSSRLSIATSYSNSWWKLRRWIETLRRKIRSDCKRSRIRISSRSYRGLSKKSSKKRGCRRNRDSSLRNTGPGMSMRRLINQLIMRD